MALSVNTNITSLMAQASLNRTQEGLGQTINRLSTGLRINDAKDDAAGLAISETMREAITGLRQANRNGNDGISLVKTAEAAMNEQLNILQRMREIATQGASGTYSTDNLTDMNLEFTALRAEVDRIANVSTFNGIALLDGTNASVTLQVGDQNNANNQLAVTLTDTDITALAINANDVTSQANARTALDALDTAIGSVTSGIAQLGADHSNLETAIRSNTDRANNLDAARSRIVDADFATESANLTKFNILSQAGTAMLAQANSMSSSVLSLLG